MGRHALVLLAAGLLVPAAADDKQDSELEGTWRMTAMEKDGKKLDADDVKRFRFVVKGDHYTTLSDDKAVEEGTFIADPARKPKALAFAVTAGEGKGERFQGIYEIEGDTLRVILAPAGKPPPTDFTSREGTRYIVGKREKAK